MFGLGGNRDWEGHFGCRNCTEYLACHCYISFTAENAGRKEIQLRITKCELRVIRK
uniref:Uncharacterized protein n=1 Tax=Uncultured archaeon GZfos26G2 TaxID=3386331 RepID=Q64AD6_UNCAG|nr:hypothetical protein GZ32E7_2 [uncultured archaeon GZfos32E7]